MEDALPVQAVSKPSSGSQLLLDFGFPREAFELCNEVTGWPRSRGGVADRWRSSKVERSIN